MVTLESDKACRCYFMRGFFFPLKNVISIFFFFMGICTDTSAFEAVFKQKHFQQRNSLQA